MLVILETNLFRSFRLIPLLESMDLIELPFESPAVEEEILFKESASGFCLSDKGDGEGISQ